MVYHFKAGAIFINVSDVSYHISSTIKQLLYKYWLHISRTNKKFNYKISSLTRYEFQSSFINNSFLNQWFPNFSKAVFSRSLKNMCILGWSRDGNQTPRSRLPWLWWDQCGVVVHISMSVLSLSWHIPEWPEFVLTT